MTELKYSLLRKQDVPRAVDSVVKVFLYDEPMTRILGIKDPEFRHFAQLVCEKAAREGLSHVAKDGQDQVAGFALNEDLFGGDSNYFSNVTPKMNPIFNILGLLDEPYLKGRTLNKNQLFHLFMVGSLPEYRGKGIAKVLTERSLDSARRQGYTHALSEATNLKSQNLLGRYGFNEVGKVDYRKFDFNGRKVFKNIGEEACKLMELKLK